MQHIDHLTEADRVDGAERIAIVPGDDLEHSGIAEALQHLGVFVLLSLLRGKERIAHGPAHLVWHGRQVVLSGGDPAQRFDAVHAPSLSMVYLP